MSNANVIFRMMVNKFGADNLGIQNVYTPVNKIEEATGIKFYDFITPDTKNIAVLFNWEFIYTMLEEASKNNYTNDMQFTYFYDSEADKSALNFNGFDKYRFAKVNYKIDFVNISEFTEQNKNINVIEKAMAGKHFDIVFSNPPYNDNLDLKILANIKGSFKKAVIIHPAVWILENKCGSFLGKFKEQYLNNIEKVIIFRGGMFGVPFMSALDICIFNNEKNNSNIEVDDQVTNCKYLAKDHMEITKFGDCWLKFGINEFAKKFDPEKSILRHVYFDREHLENLKYPIKLSMLRSGNPHFNDGYFDEKLGYYVLNKTNYFFTCIAKGDPEKYHFNCDWNIPNNQKLLFNFNTESERINFYNYCKTKFFRFLFSFYKEGANCHNGSISGIKPDTKLDSYPMKLIPWMDFTQEWNDAKLCKEFNIDEELWNYIDNFIPDYYEDYNSGF